MTERVCLLTGASGLLGTAFIERFANEYAIAAIHHRHLVEFATQAQVFVDPLCPSRQFVAPQRQVYAIQADLSQPPEIDRVLDEVLSRFGHVDLLIHGAALRCYSPVADIGVLERVETLFSVNLFAALRLCVGLVQKFWSLDPAANARSNRNVINISSSAGSFVYPDQGQSLYATSKAALNHLTYHLASELWDFGVRVNAVAPDSFPGRVATAEVLDAIRDLDSSNKTGQIVSICPAIRSSGA
jgi:NAD(P)-dependent dehydrogenase (short-subunit alcohol dehydrogenase family)